MADRVKRLAILGSTGSIGRQTLDVIRALPDRFRVMGLAAGQNLNLLAEQVTEFRPEYIYHRSYRRGQLEAGNFLPMEEIARHPEVDIVVVATSGRVGLEATLAAVQAGKSVAIANKEPLVMAGEIITRAAKKNRAHILPIDSEHSAIWQCLGGEKQPPRQIILTASGGPFRGYSRRRLEKVTPQQALRHPSWQMGKKVTIDSATLMNKGLEVIEAHWLFGVPLESISIIIHPQSVIHSMVAFRDGAVKAQLSYPDMRLPIQYALTYPERVANAGLPALDWGKIDKLTFEPPDFETFPCPRLAIEAGKTGGTAPAVLCAADEVAVDLFLVERIRFTDIPRLVEMVLAAHKPLMRPALPDIIEADRWARERLLKMAEREN